MLTSQSRTSRLKVLMTATADINKGCTGEIIGVVGSLDDTCAITVGVTEANLVLNADTEFIADLIAGACSADEDVIDIVTVDAKAIVRASLDLDPERGGSTSYRPVRVQCLTSRPLGCQCAGNRKRYGTRHRRNHLQLQDPGGILGLLCNRGQHEHRHRGPHSRRSFSCCPTPV